jgi:hypothetical protein
MSMPRLKDLVNGKNVSKEEAKDLRKQHEIDAQRKREICEIINQIDEPISFTVHQATGNWTMRNIAFWKKLRDKDEQVTEYIAYVLGDVSS